MFHKRGKALSYAGLGRNIGWNIARNIGTLGVEHCLLLSCLIFDFSV